MCVVWDNVLVGNQDPRLDDLWLSSLSSGSKDDPCLQHLTGTDIWRRGAPTVARLNLTPGPVCIDWTFCAARFWPVTRAPTSSISLSVSDVWCVRCGSDFAVVRETLLCNVCGMRKLEGDLDRLLTIIDDFIDTIDDSTLKLKLKANVR